MTKKDKLLLESISETPSDLVFWSFRYFLGRMTIATVSFAEDLAKAWPHLDERVQKLIMRELEHEFEQDDRARKHREEMKAQGKPSMYDSSLPLGMDCDRGSWQLVRNAYWQQLPYEHPFRQELHKRALELIEKGHDSHGDDDEGCPGNSHS